MTSTIMAAGEAMADREILGTLWGYLWNPEHGFRGRLAGAMGLLLVSKALNITVSSAMSHTSSLHRACCRAGPAVFALRLPRASKRHCNV